LQKSTAEKKPLMGIGSCLAGNAVRYNAQTKRPNQQVRDIAESFELRAFCPEMGIGMGVPRAPIHLVGDETKVRALDVNSHTHDFTDKLAGYADTVLSLAPGLCGYILVKGSPSCGYERVKRYTEKGHGVASDQQGIFATALGKADPLLPLEDDGRLNDPGLRESFVTRAYTYHDWKQLLSEGLSAHRLIAFYTRYKYLVMAHHAPSYKVLGPMLADAGKQDLTQLADTFIASLMAALSHRATRRSHSNVLYHISGYLKQNLADAERQRLKTLIDQYRLGQIPLLVPVTMLKHHFANSPNAYIATQVFMAPYPDELQLRNLV
jgi:uncharacterized protein YbgA (DUF1722 family)/uncharacterized protein YbbK (DUF523 family)